MTKVDPSMGVQDLLGKDGLPFARVISLSDGSNVALARHREEGNVELIMFMTAMGVASTTRIGVDQGSQLDERSASALLSAVDYAKAQEFHSKLVTTIKEKMPQIASLYEVQSLMSIMEPRLKTSTTLAQVHEYDGRQFLSVRAEVGKPLAGKSVLRIFGENVEETFTFANPEDRDATFSSAVRMTPLLSSVADRQSGNELLSSAARRPKGP